MKNILIVCVGNICRSPMAEGLLKQYSEQNHLNLSVSSAGLAAMIGYQADAKSIQLMENRHIDIHSHMPRQITFEILCETDLVLVMETWQQKEIGCLFPSVYGKVHTLGKWGKFEVPDPYKKPLEYFEDSLSLIEKGLDQWKEKVWRSHV